MVSSPPLSPRDQARRERSETTYYPSSDEPALQIGGRFVFSHGQTRHRLTGVEDRVDFLGAVDTEHDCEFDVGCSAGSCDSDHVGRLAYEVGAAGSEPIGHGRPKARHRHYRDVDWRQQGGDARPSLAGGDDDATRVGEPGEGPG